MEKRISFYEFQSVKSVAKACEPIIKKRNKVRAEIEALADEYKSAIAQIQALEAGITQVIGIPVEAIVKKVIETDAKGNKTTKYLPTDIVSYDAVKKQYVITLPDEPATENPPVTEAGNDFDEDTTASQEENVAVGSAPWA